MGKQSVATSLAPEITIEQVSGNLSVKGWGDPEVTVDADPEELQMEAQDDLVRISCTGDCSIRMPQGATVKIEAVHGDASLKYLEEPVSIQVVHGSLALRSVGGAELGTVHGELSAKGIAGDLHAEQISGNASIRNVQGRCELGEVAGNLDAHDIGGEIVAQANGNARLRLSHLAPASPGQGGANYEVRADGNVHCHIPEDANLKLSLSSGAEVIRIKMPGETKTVRAAQHEMTLGSGENSMELASGGALYLFGQGLDWGETETDFDAGFNEDFGQQIAQQVQSQIQSQMQAIQRQMTDQINRLADTVSKTGLPPDQIESILERTREVSEKEVERAQEKLRKAQEKLERKLEAAQRRQELKSRSRGGRSWNFDFSPRPAAPPPPAQEAASDEERMMILRMLEEKKISLAEAEQLLEALEGK
jgi:hypothetical protein